MDSAENAAEVIDTTPVSDEQYTMVDDTTPDSVENEPNIDAMTDEEFEAFMDGEPTPNEPEGEEPEVVVENLDEMYKTQMAAPEAKLDKPILIKFNGTVHKVDSVRELKDLAEKGVSLTKKSQELSEQSRLLETLEANGYDADSLRRLAEQHKGQPLAEMDDKLVQVDRIADDILASDYLDTFKEVTQQLPKEVHERLQRDPELLSGIAQDVKSGLLGNIIPEVNRLMAIKGMSFEDAYYTAGKSYMERSTQHQEKAAKLRAQPTTTRLNPTSSSKSVWEMSDSEFDKYFQ